MGFSLKKAMGGAVEAMSLGTIKSGGSGGSGGAIKGIDAPRESERRKSREKDIEMGRGFAKKVLPAGSLGRITNAADIRDSMSVLRGQLGGFTAPEMQAQRDVATQGINRSTEMARKRLAAAQARSGVRGATAAKQQGDIISSGIQATSDFERNLMMGQRGEQARAAQALMAPAAELGQFDLSQAAREKFAELSTGLGFAQIGSAERSGKLGAEASVAAANAQRPSGGLLGGLFGK